jgi:hypothetical protein
VVNRFIKTLLVFLCTLGSSQAIAQDAAGTQDPSAASKTNDAVESARNLIAEARAARKAGNLEQTTILLLKAYELDPKIVLLNNLGKVYEEMGRFDLAYATYKRVVDNPTTSQELRALDKERMALIYDKLTATMIFVPPEVSWEQVWVNTKGYPMGSGIELSVPTGPLMVDIFDAKSTVLVRIDMDGPAGRRLVLNDKLTKGLDKRFGVMSWDRATRKLKALTIDDVPVRASLTRAKGVQIAPGTYRIGLEWVGQPKTIVTVDITAGMLIELKPAPIKAKPPAPLPAMVQSPKTMLNKVDQPPPSLKAQAPTPAPTTSWLLLTGQVAITAAGLVAGGLGYADYSTGQNELEGVKKEQDGINPAFPRPEGERVIWEQQNDEATARVNQGIVKMSLGGVAALGAIIWIFAADTAPNQVVISVDQHQAIRVGGTF